MNDQPVEIPINGILDLHTFAPSEVRFLVRDYIEECLALNIFELRIIHGKGIGNLRRMVHSVLDKHESVERFELGKEDSGSWGATLVWLKKRSMK